MSDLNPKGYAITLGGVERHFLFTLNVIDEIQSEYGRTPIEVMSGMSDEMERPSVVKFLVKTLLNDEAAREKFKGNDSFNEITDKEAGWLVTSDNIIEVETAILEAYGISVPEPSQEEEADPN